MNYQKTHVFFQTRTSTGWKADGGNKSYAYDISNTCRDQTDHVGAQFLSATAEVHQPSLWIRGISWDAVLTELASPLRRRITS